MLLVRRGVVWAVEKSKGVRRALTAEDRYLNLPVKTGVPSRYVKMVVDGKVLREFKIRLAEGGADWWAFMDLAPLKGKSVTLEVEGLPGDSKALEAITQSDQIVGQGTLYHEALRPQFHFSTRRGWQNDPNGLVFYDGEYHLFYQHDPYEEQNVTNLHWGHAVSKDLVHWTELPEAIYPEGKGGIASGSAVVDRDNTAGFQAGAEKPLVAIFTNVHVADKDQYDLSQCLAFSNDRGRTWTKYKHNPVLPSITKNNRDPKVFWYAPEKKWVMALFLDQADYSAHPDIPPEKLLKMFADKSSFGLFSSKDLKTWEKMSEFKIPSEAECPDFFEIAVDGNPKNTRWITFGASGRYMIGTFDGKTFTRESGPHVLHRGNCFYAAQTFNNAPAADGRRILIPWGGNNDAPTTPLFKGMPFNQMMGLPVELTLRSTEDAGLQLFVVPVKELESLRTSTRTIKPQPLTAGPNPLAAMRGELIELRADITVGRAMRIVFTLRGVPVTYDVQANELSCSGEKAVLKAEGGKIRLRILVDRTSIDIFGNDGRLYMPMAVDIDANDTSLWLSAVGRGAFVNALDVAQLESIWM